WADDHQRVGAIVCRGIHRRRAQAGRLILPSTSAPAATAAATAKSSETSTTARAAAASKTTGPAASATAAAEPTEASESAEASKSTEAAGAASSRSAHTLRRRPEQFIDQPRRVRRAGIFQLEHFHFRRVGQMRVQGADDLDHAP